MENQVPKPTSLRPALLELARQASVSPGVYLMKDAAGGVLYVGKAKNLKNRLVTYFQSAIHEIPRIDMLVNRVERFDVILTETESEALILEATLIKKHKPKFNIRLKDDKNYPYLKIQIHDAFPRIEWTRKVLPDGARYFGPFPSAWAARQVMNLLIETFHLRDCSENVFRHRSRPCILNQMGKCDAPCVGLISQNQYQDSIREVIQVLEGKSAPIVQALRKAMEEAALREEYELAATFRDQLQHLELVTQTQGVLEPGSLKHRDVVGLARRDSETRAAVLRIRKGLLVSVQHFHLQNTDSTQSDSEILFDFVVQYYSDEKKKAAGISIGENANEFVVQRGVDVLLPESFSKSTEEIELLEKSLGIQIRVSETALETQLLNVAKSNAQHALEQDKKKAGGHGVKALEEVQDKLHLSKLPHRIECYDISNIQGEEAVASRVVFIDGAPDKNYYRRYKIKTVQGSNDFAMMREVLGRRFSRTEEDLPDLVVVDGGKGQLSQAVAILDELSVQGVGVVGLAKARTESDFRATEVKSSFERIFIPNRKNPVPLLPHTSAYKLLTHVRDEAHRFAISYHRLLRDKKSMRSDL